MFSNSSNKPKANKELNAKINLILLTDEAATPKDIQRFYDLSALITQDIQSSDSNFNKTLEFFTQLYKNKLEPTAAPIWQLLSADIIFKMFISTIPESGLSLNHPHIKNCLAWAETIIIFPSSDHSSDKTIKVSACNWIAGIYKRRGISQAEKNSTKPDSRNPLIHKSLQYYEKKTALINSSPEATYYDISLALLKIAEVREQFLPDNATLQDKYTKKLIQALEQVIAFHANVPSDKRTMVKYFGPSHALLELDVITGKKNAEEAKAEEKKLDETQPPQIIWEQAEVKDAEKNYAISMKTLAKLYANTPKSHGKNPDYQKAVILLDKISEPPYSDYANADDLLNKPEIVAARKEMIAAAYAKLTDLTNHYLRKSNLDPAKQDIFKSLKLALEETDDKKYKHERIIAFKNKLTDIDKSMLFVHRTETWKRYSYNAFSILTIVPAAKRAYNSYSKYNTIKFWKPESQRALECATKTLSRLEFGNRN